MFAERTLNLELVVLIVIQKLYRGGDGVKGGGGWGMMMNLLAGLLSDEANIKDVYRLYSPLGRAY